mmetsp:Transcript_10115/g.14797  ORF Transcript_10115/g.14797 Transcript_10115/m.14797 type:complete len:169 (+) Transcript_10115:189-695(+)|eukprot:CAMPEP_0195510652 /NCGR_PEP_ID=MMETSP0794_2-20130614/3235_1 /TAXON_ID=515487 /ORGANISM="Stephanopyxis turris, Strain CCMP 815" /LENGTH=168 /DNA_ID=CAMNT_0040638115 /DNA_START=184 /DNA_END=690 /DNA_ORIENTATION=+
MKPDWDKLMEEYADSPTQLVADVDCTAAGKSLCGEHNVKGYPTIKWGDPADLQDYLGGRDLNSLRTFATENLKPVCSPFNIDLCDDDKKAEIKKFQAMSDEELAAAIKKGEDEMDKAESEFKDFVSGLQKKYEEAMRKKDATLEEIKTSGLGLMKSVKKSKIIVSDEL